MIFRPALPALLAAAVLAVAVSPAAAGDEPAPADPRWLERVDPLDRQLLDELIGYAPPAFTPELTWIGTETTWKDLRGKVVVLQSWTNRSAAGRRAPQLVMRALKTLDDAEDVAVVFLHTPEGADGLQRFIERRSLEFPVALDSRGGYCDAVGAYRQPVNVVVDRNGTIRYAGLNARGLARALALLAEEPYDPRHTPPARPEPEREPEAAAAEFPTVTGPVLNATDLRGKLAPEFWVSKWITRQPNAAGKVVVLDFWATWCTPCVAAVPHMNDLADQFRDRVCVVGISDESSGKFDRGLEQRNLKERDFRYALALDSSARMKRAIDIRGIPHCVVISSDWIVRWQGHPRQLTAALLEQIVKADGAGRDGPARSPRERWTREADRAASSAGS